MLSLFFVFFAATISAENLLAPKNIFAKAPKAFISSFSTADKATLDKLLEMTNQLLQEGVDAVALATSNRDTAAGEASTAETNHGDATTALDEAKQGLEAASSLVITKQSQLDGEEVVLQNTINEKDRTDGLLAQASTKLEKTQQRVTDEKRSLNDILQLLAEYEDVRVGFAETNRKLLSTFVMVESDAIDDIEAKVNEMIADADSELQEDTLARDNAQTAYNEAVAAHDQANTAVATTQGHLSEAQLKESQAQIKKDNKENALASAATALSAAQATLGDLENTLVKETDRVAGEKNTLDQVVVVLEDLISKAD